MEWTDEETTLKMYPDVRDASYSKNHEAPFILFLGEKLQWSLLPGARSVGLLSAFNTLPTCKNYIYVLPFISCSQMVTAKAIFSKSFLQSPSILDKTCFSGAERMKRKHREFTAIIKNKLDPYPAPESFSKENWQACQLIHFFQGMLSANQRS